MKHLLEYIIEQQTKGTHSNSERLEELRNWLKNKKYKDYVNTLNKMLEDPKAKTLLEDGFGSELGDIEFKYSAKLIPANELRPTQSEIDVDKSLKMGLSLPDNIDKDFSQEIIIANMPLVTFNGKWIIDGHHRWSEPAILNPEGKMLCFDYKADITPEEMLKAVQGAIATVMAKKDQKLPLSKVEGTNLYDKEWTREKLEKYVREHITNAVIQKLATYTDIKDPEKIIEYIVDNALDLQKSNRPLSDAPERGLMPQTNKGCEDPKNKQTAYPSHKGSALNKLATGKVDKKTIE